MNRAWGYGWSGDDLQVTLDPQAILELDKAKIMWYNKGGWKGRGAWISTIQGETKERMKRKRE